MLSHGKISQYHINALIAFIFGWCVFTMTFGGSLCIPVHKMWDPEVPGACRNLASFYYLIQIPNVVTDMLMIICPILLIMSLHLEKRTKISASAMFLLGML